MPCHRPCCGPPGDPARAAGEGVVCSCLSSRAASKAAALLLSPIYISGRLGAVHFPPCGQADPLWSGWGTMDLVAGGRKWGNPRAQHSTQPLPSRRDPSSRFSPTAPPAPHLCPLPEPRRRARSPWQRPRTQQPWRGLRPPPRPSPGPPPPCGGSRHRAARRGSIAASAAPVLLTSHFSTSYTQPGCGRCLSSPTADGLGAVGLGLGLALGPGLGLGLLCPLWAAGLSLNSRVPLLLSVAGGLVF